MNVDNNRRFQETEKKIFTAFSSLAAQKELSKITVSDICQKAQIHRTTFYGHFEDVNALRSAVELRQLQKWTDGFLENDGTWNLYDGMYKFVSFYYKNQKLVRFQMKENEVKDYGPVLFQSSVSVDYREKYMKRFQLSDEVEMKCHQTFISSGIMNVIYRWVQDGCVETPEEITNAICKIIKCY